MIRVCRQFLTDRLQGLILPDGYTKPYTAADPGRTIFFKDLPTDFLKDNDYACAALPLVDRTRKNGRLIGRVRTIIPATETEARRCSQTLLRRRFNREIIFRVLMYAPEEHLWGTGGYTGMVEQFSQAVAGFHHILDSDDSVILVEPQDVAQPWDKDVERGRKLDRPPLGIVRVQFSGGIQTSKAEALIDGVEINPQYQ